MRVYHKLCLICFGISLIVFISWSASESNAQSPRPSVRASGASNEDSKPKFEELLDTKDFTHFRGYQSDAIGEGWKMEGKTLVFDGTGSGDIITKETFDNFELQFEWSISEGGNSGVLYHVTLGDGQPYFSGPEIQVLDDDKHPDGKSELTSAGALYGLYPATDKKLKPVGSWNSSKIVVDGNKITHTLNGKKVFEAESGSDDWNQRLAASKFKDWEKFNQSTSGHIAFQNHGNAVKFRKIRIKKLAPSAEQQTAGATPAQSGDVLPGLSSERPGRPGLQEAGAEPTAPGVDK